MILPPLFGAHIKNNDRAWEANRITHMNMDIFLYKKLFPFLFCTNASLDIMCYKKPDTQLNLTHGVLDIMTYRPNS